MSRRREERLTALGNIAAKAQENVTSIKQSEAYRSPTRMLVAAQIVPSPYQARRDFSNLADLVTDITKNGVLQPILVRPLGDDQYELVAGERRWRAAQQAGKTTVPAVVRSMTDAEARIYGLTENLQREDLNAYEVARAVVDLVAARTGLGFEDARQQVGSKRPPEAISYALDEALSIVGKGISPRSFARHYVPLLQLSGDLIAAIEEGAAYTAVLALRKANAEQRTLWLPKVKSGEWGVRDVEAALKERRETDTSSRSSEQAPDWDKQWRHLSGLYDSQRLAQLDGRKQRKARRLMEELTELLKS